MNEKERLYQQYEDAFFTLLMNEVAEDDGNALLKKNEQLLADERAAVPEQLHRRCLRTIKKSEQKVKIHRIAKKTARTLNRVAMLLLIPVLLYGVAFAASETVRVKTLNFLIEELDIGTRYVFQSEDGANTDSDAVLDRVIQVIQEAVPTDYTLVSQHVSSDSADYYFTNGQSEEISISVFFLPDWDTTITLDTEDAKTNVTIIGNQSVTVIQKENRYQLAWLNSEEQAMYAISGTSGTQQTTEDIVNHILCQ